MSDHIIEFTRARQPGDQPEWGQCKCGANSGWLATRDETEAWAATHRQFVGTVKASLSRRNPGLRDQYDYYLGMSQDPSVTKTERAQWAALAKEIETRVQPVDAGAGQDPLF